MNALIKTLAALSVLWSVCELLLPDGQLQKGVRFAVSVLVMATLVSGMGRLMGLSLTLPTEATQPVMASAADESTYAAHALRALANQAEGYCVRLCERAGYAATAAVWLTTDGALHRIELCLTGWLSPDAPPLLSEEEVAALIARELNADEGLIHRIAPDSA